MILSLKVRVKSCITTCCKRWFVLKAGLLCCHRPVIFCPSVNCVAVGMTCDIDCCLSDLGEGPLLWLLLSFLPPFPLLSGFLEGRFSSIDCKAHWGILFVILGDTYKIELNQNDQHYSFKNKSKLVNLLPLSVCRQCLPARVFTCLVEIPLMSVPPFSTPSLLLPSSSSSSSGVTWMPISTGSTTFPSWAWWCRLSRSGLPPSFPPCSPILSKQPLARSCNWQCFFLCSIKRRMSPSRKLFWHWPQVSRSWSAWRLVGESWARLVVNGSGGKLSGWEVFETERRPPSGCSTSVVQWEKQREHND